jgi:hypothetical protein
MDSITILPEMADISFPCGHETDQGNKFMNKFRYVKSFADNRSTRIFENSPALRLEYDECKAMLRYWFHAVEATSSFQPRPNEFDLGYNSIFGSILLFHLIAMMLHIPIHDINTAIECIDISSRNAAIGRLGSGWTDQEGKQACLGLWNAQQIIRIVGIIIDSGPTPLWFIQLLTEAVRPLWIYSVILHSHEQQGITFNHQRIRLDPDEDWHTFSISALGEESLRNFNGDFLTLRDLIVLFDVKNYWNRHNRWGRSRDGR